MKKSVFSQSKVWIIGFSSALLLSASLVSAGPFFGKHHSGNPLEKMLDHVDLSDQQEIEVEAILSTLPDDKRKKGFGMMKGMINLNPEDPNYMEQVEEHADAASKMLAQHIKQIARARQDIYAILTPEQKDELAEAIERKMKRMEKRMAKHD